MGLWTLSIKCCSCVNHLQSFTQYELAHLKKERRKKEEKSILLFGEFLALYFLMTLAVSVVMKTLKDDWYVTKLITLRFWEIFCIVIYCVSVLSLRNSSLLTL